MIISRLLLGGKNMNEFIDCHCHIFNIVDIPLYATIQGKLNVNTINRFTKSLGITLFAPFNLIKKGDDIVATKEDFIRFFERDLKDSIIKFEEHLSKIPEIDLSKTLITPLIMDFDCIKEVEENSLGISNLEFQTQRLIKGIKASKNKIKICPFIGFDLRKLVLDDNGLDAIKKLWKKYSDSSNKNASINNLISGSILGIKIYPPIGFNPYPVKKNERKKYIEFYKWCIKEDIPITVHCQKGSYSAELSSKDINRMTHPQNWLNLLEENPQLKNLRINFAHFGGEDGVEDMLDPGRIFSDGIDKNTWTYTIIKLLQRYPNTYSDISAYNYGKSFGKINDYSKNLKKVIELDYLKKFKEGKYSVSSKLLWGSDVPMVISEECYDSSYANYYKHLENLVNKSKKLNQNDKRKFIENLTVNNPKKFLKIK